MKKELSNEEMSEILFDRMLMEYARIDDDSRQKPQIHVGPNRSERRRLARLKKKGQ